MTDDHRFGRASTVLGSSFEMLSYHTVALQASTVTGLRTLAE